MHLRKFRPGAGLSHCGCRFAKMFSRSVLGVLGVVDVAPSSFSLADVVLFSVQTQAQYEFIFHALLDLYEVHQSRNDSNNNNNAEGGDLENAEM
jgi:hypothetical protein